MAPDYFWNVQVVFVWEKYLGWFKHVKISYKETCDHLYMVRILACKITL